MEMFLMANWTAMKDKGSWIALVAISVFSLLILAGCGKISAQADADAVRQGLRHRPTSFLARTPACLAWTIPNSFLSLRQRRVRRLLS